LVFLGSDYGIKMAGNKVTINTHKHRNNITLEVNTQHIGQGTFRRAFQGKLTQGILDGFDQGDHVVVKTIVRPRFANGSRLQLVDVKTQTKAQRLIQAFLQELGTGYRVPEVPGGPAVRVIMCSTTFLTLREPVNFGTFSTVPGEQVALEKLIRGNYEKFNSSSGWSSGKHMLPDALSHWTWVHSQGDYLLCDLQGVRKSDAFVFTDPVIITKKTLAYGDADLGPSGMRNWFAHHRCNALCRHMRINTKRPDNPAHFFEAHRTTYMNAPKKPRLCTAVNSKPCRYGSACSKAGCFYAHPA
jgi:hypothetical protein